VKSLVNYWLCITNEKNWEIIRKRNVWIVPKRSRGIIQKVKTGDLLAFYVAPKKVAGVFKTVSEPYVDEEVIFSADGFSGNERFSYRVRLEPVVLAKEYVDFSSLIPRLSFIVNKKRWSGYLRRAMVQIPKEDYDLLYGQLLKKVD
jgi:predicted RNA-binding protein